MPPCLFRRYYTTVQRITQALQNKNTAKTQAYHSSSCRSPLYSKTKTPLSGVFWSYRTDFSRATCCSAERAARTPRANASITICRRRIIRHHADRRYTLKQKHRSAVFSGATGRTSAVRPAAQPSAQRERHEQSEYYDMPQAYHSSSCRSPLYSKTKTPLSGVFWSYWPDLNRRPADYELQFSRIMFIFPRIGLYFYKSI